MDDSLKDLSNKDIIEMYSRNNDFISFLDKELMKIEQKRDENV